MHETMDQATVGHRPFSSRLTKILRQTCTRWITGHRPIHAWAQWQFGHGRRKHACLDDPKGVRHDGGDDTTLGRC